MPHPVGCTTWGPACAWRCHYTVEVLAPRERKLVVPLLPDREPQLVQQQGLARSHHDLCVPHCGF